MKSAHPISVCRRAFSLIEIMISVALLSFIVLGLLAMFNQVQRAFRTSMTQVDVLESGRLVMDMMARELEQMTPAKVPATEYYLDGTTNFFVTVSPGFPAPSLQGLPGTTLGQPGTQDRRTNVVQRFFFLTRVNQDWVGTGYDVLEDYAGAPVGSLYRFVRTNTPRRAHIVLSSLFSAIANHNQRATWETNLSRVADGIVHLRVQPYDDRGYPILPYPYWPTNELFRATTTNFINNTVIRIPDAYYWSNAVPAYVDLELGVLQQNVLDTYRGIGSDNPEAQLRYLSNHVAEVHLFRQRIPIRNADFSVYK